MHPVRKKNRLTDYDYSYPGAYFLTVCTQNRACILSSVVRADDHIGPEIRLTKIGNVVKNIPN